MSCKAYHYHPPSSILAPVRALLDFVYPRYCAACDSRLSMDEMGLCPLCLLTLPRYVEATDRAWERLQGTVYPIEGFVGGLHFEKETRVQHLIHSVKYHSNREAAWAIGRLIAQEKRLSVEDFDFIVPVPVSNIRLLKRGYNQSFLLAQGVSMGSGIPVAANALQRTKHLRSQTHRRRAERLFAMKDAFSLGDDTLPKGARILLLDDLLTTGSTLVAAADALALAEPGKLILMTIAVDVLE